MLHSFLFFFTFLRHGSKNIYTFYIYFFPVLFSTHQTPFTHISHSSIFLFFYFFFISCNLQSLFFSLPIYFYPLWPLNNFQSYFFYGSLSFQWIPVSYSGYSRDILTVLSLCSRRLLVHCPLSSPLPISLYPPPFPLFPLSLFVCFCFFSGSFFIFRFTFSLPSFVIFFLYCYL